MTDTSTPQLLIRGLDSLYVSYYLDTATSEVDWDELAYRKERARTERGELAELQLGSEKFALMPYGKKPYTYMLVSRAFEVRLAERLQPSCHVQFYSEALWIDGLDKLEGRFRDWCRSLRLVHVKPDIVARADWAFDYHIAEIDFDTDSFVSYSAKDATYREHRKAQTFSFGRGDVVVRVYDKVAEIEQQSNKAWFFDLWGRKDQVLRVEFQVRGERLREAGIATLSDLRQLQHDLLRELASNHTSLRAKARDANRSRWPLHPLWKRLLSDIASMPQTGLVRSVDPESALRWRRQQQLRALYGSLKGLAAIHGLIGGSNEPVPFQTLLRALPRLLEREHSETLWREDVQQRMTAHRFGKW